MGKALSAIRGSFFDFIDDPWKHVGCEEKSARFFEDGLLVIENGLIKAFGHYEEIAPKFPGIETVHIQDRLILPGFIDGHVHMAQVRVLGAYGHQLLGWLQKWIFAEERKYCDPAYAAEGSRHFFDNLLASGTTTAQVFTTHSRVSTEALFEEASKRNMLIIGGLTGLDRFAPEESMDNADNFYRDTKDLIQKYHRNGRNLYAITPRFAFGASVEMMEACGKLKKEFPDAWVNTHVSENPTETFAVLKTHRVDDYLAAYEKYGLVGPKFTGAHGVWLSDNEFKRISKAGAAVCFCPTSNLFLGSGLFRLGKATDPEQRVRLSFGSDTAGGNRFSMISVLDEAYKIGMCNNTMLDGSIDPRQQDLAQAERNRLNSYRAFWSITLGGAEALYLDDRVGNFQPGKEADFVVLDWNGGPFAMRWHQSLIVGDGSPKTMTEVSDLLFGVMTVGDDRCVDETWVFGKQMYKKQCHQPALALSH